MGESFSKFLNQKRFWGIDHVQKTKYPAIPEKELGEWAWREYLACIEQGANELLMVAGKFKKKNKLNAFALKGMLLKEIALACLGKREIEKKRDKNA